MAENTFTYNFNELILAKQQLKSIIQDGGLEPGEVFAQYPGYIASIIEGGGTSSYLLVTKEELYACGYITAYDVSNMSYATQSYVADYVSTHSGGGSGDLSDYVTYTYLESKEYITAEDIPRVDLTDYPTYTYLYTYVGDALNEYAPDLTYYPTFDDISGMGYITMGDVSGCGYITAADIPEVDLSYVLSTYNLRYINETPFGNGKQLYLLNSGLDVSDTGDIYPESYSYSQIVGYLNNDYHPWVGAVTMKNYVEGRIAELESSSVTPSYLAANYVSYGYASANYVSYSYAYNTFVSYAYLGDLEQISEYILGSGSSSAPENVYATKVELASYATKLELGAYVSKIELSNASYVTSSDLPIIDENIIPKASDTYFLGDTSNYYHSTYTNRIRGNSSVNFVTAGNNRLTVSSTAFRPMQQNYNLGSSDYPFATAYISNIYNFIWTGTSAQYAALDNYTTYQIYLIKES